MAWNNDDWVWVADGPTGGIYRNKYNPELYADANGAVGTAETFGLGKSSGISYGPRLTDEDGSVTGIPGATYQMGSNGLPASVVRPSSGGSGGSSSPTNVYITQNPGELYQDIVSDGTDGYPPGTVLQVNQLTGAKTVKYRPSTTEPASLYNDRDGNGYDDQTGLPVGVVRIPGTEDKSTGFLGLWYQGKRVNPDGSEFTGGSGGGGSDLDLSNKISQGGVTYVWSNSQNKYVPAPGLPLTSGPGSTPSNGGTYINSSTARTSSGGGSSVAAASRDYAGEQAASDARQAQMAADARAWQSAQNDIDRQIRAQEFQANYGLNVAQFQVQQARDQAAQKSSDLRDFSSAISDTDMAKFQAVLYANGYNAGGTINNRLREDPNAFFSELANVRAAGLLDQIRNGYGSVAAPGIPATGGLGTTGSAPAGGATSPQPGATTGTLPSTQQNQGANPVTGQVGSGPIPPYITDATGKKVLNPAYLQEQAALRDEENRQQAWATRTGWYPVSGPTGILYTEYVNGQPTGKTMTQEQKAQQDALDQFNPIAQSSVIANDQGAGAGYWIRPVIYDALGQASGTSVQNVMPGAAGFTGYGPQQTEIPYGNDNIQRAVGGASIDGIPVQPKGTGVYTGPSEATTGPYAPGSFGGGSVAPTSTAPWDVPSGIAGVPLLNDNGTAGTAPTAGGEQWMGTNSAIQPRAVVAMAHGGGPVSGSLIVGDPQRPGVPNPELVTGDNIRVTPLNHMPAPVAGSLMMGMRKAAFGTTETLSSWGGRRGSTNEPRPIASTAPTTQTTTPTATTAGSGTTTSPVAPTTPSTVSTPSTGTSPTGSAPATGSLTPTGQTVQQPTAPAPATGGLGSITDIVNGTATPTSQALLDEIAQWRQNVPLPNVDPLSLDFQRLDPLTQQSILQARQTRSYIPVAAQQYEINKYRIGGGRALAGSLAF